MNPAVWAVRDIAPHFPHDQRKCDDFLHFPSDVLRVGIHSDKGVLPIQVPQIAGIVARPPIDDSTKAVVPQTASVEAGFRRGNSCSLNPGGMERSPSFVTIRAGAFRKCPPQRDSPPETFHFPATNRDSRRHLHRRGGPALFEHRRQLPRHDVDED